MFPSKNKKKRQKYKIVEAKTGQADGISFELVNKQGCFLRVKGTELIPDRDNGSDSNFSKISSFFIKLLLDMRLARVKYALASSLTGSINSLLMSEILN